MVNKPRVDLGYLLNNLSELLNIPSPTEFTKKDVEYGNKSSLQGSQLVRKINYQGSFISCWKDTLSGHATVALTCLNMGTFHNCKGAYFNALDDITHCILPSLFNGKSSRLNSKR